MTDVSFWQIMALAVIQGVTEFLPISSSGHLVVAAQLLGGEALEVAELNVVLHLGTLLSIVVFYWHRIWRLMGEDRRVVPLLVVGTLPAVAVGLPLKIKFGWVLEDPLLTGVLLCVTGSLLLAVTWIPRRTGQYQQMGYGQALLIGISQAVAVLPGLSRSGATISAGLGLGLEPRSAATFSFLLAIPAIGGAGVLEAASMATRSTPMSTPPSYLVIGALVSFVVGLGALSWLVRWLERGQLHWFAIWCIPLGLYVIARNLAA